MLDIDILEKRWIIYKIKKYLPYIAFFMILIISYILFFLNIEKEKVYKIKKLDKKVLIIDSNITNIKNLHKITLSPSMNFIQEIDEKDYLQPKKIKAVITPIKEKKLETITIKHKNNNQDIENLVKRFEKNNNPSLSLFIAKKYYKQGKYDKAYKYALITNDLDNKIEDSWLIFTKSLVKLDRKQKAINLLTKYIKHSNSENAKLLLDEIKDGKLR